jgi:hypothetical protein
MEYVKSIGWKNPEWMEPLAVTWHSYDVNKDWGGGGGRVLTGFT